MLYLVDQSEVIERLGVGGMPATVPVIASALKAAHLRMESELDTAFKQQSNVDVFYLDERLHNGVLPGGFFRLRLRNGFVRDTPAVVVKCSTDNATLDDGSGAEDVLGWKIDAQHGYLLVPKEYREKWVSVAYDSGFVSATGDDTMVDPDESVPDALKEAVVAYCPVVAEFSSTTAAGGKPVNDGYKAAADHALAILTPLIRKKNFCWLPVY